MNYDLKKTRNPHTKKWEWAFWDKSTGKTLIKFPNQGFIEYNPLPEIWGTKKR